MNKLWIFGLLIVFCVGLVSAYDGDLCNDTHSPCGGGCTSTDLSFMFDFVTDFNNSVGQITGWDTSCVTNMANLFSNSDFDQPIGSWDVSHVTSMSSMFEGGQFNQDISAWNVGNVISMAGMFATSIFNQPLNNWDTSNVISMAGMFATSIFNQPINNWNVQNVISFKSMFLGSLFNQSLSNWKPINAYSFLQMFRGARYFNQPIFTTGSHIGNSLNTVNFGQMFRDAIYFNQNIGNWNMTNLLNLQNMLGGVNLSTSNYDALLLGWSGQSVPSNVPFACAGCQYSSAGLVGRNILVSHGWIITGDSLLPCTPSWIDSSPACNSGNNVTKLYVDANHCGTGSPPADNGSVFVCPAQGFVGGSVGTPVVVEQVPASSVPAPVPTPNIFEQFWNWLKGLFGG